MNTTLDFIEQSAAAVVPSQRLIKVLGRLQQYSCEHIPGSVYIYDLVDQHTICSSYSIAEILGYTSDHIAALGPLGLAELIHPDDLDKVSAHFQRFSALVEGEVIAVEYRMRKADESWCWLRSQESLLVQTIDRFPLQVLGMVQNITPLVAASTQAPASTKPSAEQTRPQANISIGTRRRRLNFTRQKRFSRNYNRRSFPPISPMAT